VQIAFVTDEIPRPNRAGYHAYNHALISALAARGHDVRIVLAWPRLPAPVVRYGDSFDPARVRVAGGGLVSLGGCAVMLQPRAALRAAARAIIDQLPARWGEGLRRRGRAADHGMVDSVLGRWMTAEEAAAAARLSRGADLVLADTIFRAPALAALPAHGPARGIVAHDVFHARHASLAARGLRLSPPTLTEAEEAGWLATAPLIAAIQANEAREIARLAPAARVVVAPMPARFVPRPAGIPRVPGRIAFVGSVAPHNVDGMRWFLAEVWPRIRAAQPDAALDVCGTVGGGLGDVPDGVLLHGNVPDLAPLLHRASVAIAPLLAGSGQVIKLLDYAAHGLATVTTSQGTAGYAPGAGWPFEIADGPEAFAAATLHLAAGGAEAREARAEAFVRRNSAELVLRPFIDAVEAAAVPGARPAAPRPETAVAPAG
jgi:glycosyltransferase involved in cell wall biosynthesis